MNEYGKQVKKTMDTYMNNPDSIDKEISDIQNATHGVEVRGALAAGVKKSFDKSVEAETTSNSAREQVGNIQNQVNQLVVDGDSSVEAAQARVDSEGNTYNTLKERLDEKETEFSSQLAQLAINVKSFGATGDGITDDIDALETARDFASSNGKVLYLPEGIYAISRTFSIGSELKVKGAGIGKTYIKWIGGDTGHVISMDGSTNTISRTTLEDLDIDCSKKSDVALYIRYLTNGSKIKNIQIRHVGKVGVDFSHGWYCSFENVRVRIGGTGDGWLIGDDVNTSINGVSFTDCQAHDCGGAGFNIKARGFSNVFNSCIAELCYEEGFKINRGGGLVFNGCYSEANGLGDESPYHASIGREHRTFGVVFNGGYFLGDNRQVSSVIVDRAQDVSFVGTHFENVSLENRPDYHIEATENAEGINSFANFITPASVANTKGKITIFSRVSPTELANGLISTDATLESLNVTNTLDATSKDNAPLKSAGGLAIGRRAFIGERTRSRDSYIDSFKVDILANSTTKIRVTHSSTYACFDLNVGIRVTSNGSGHLRLTVGGEFSAQSTYNVEELARWELGSVSISQITKGNNYFEFTISNNSINSGMAYFSLVGSSNGEGAHISIT